jgi:hypothetical protein
LVHSPQITKKGQKEEMKEHSGGTPDVGYISLSEWDYESFAVPIQQFDFSAMDRPSDLIVEAHKEGRDPEPVMKAIVYNLVSKRLAAFIAGFVACYRETENPRMLNDTLTWCTGMGAAENLTCTRIAEQYGVTKQAVDQYAKRLCEKFDLPQSITMRDEEARKNMRNRNSRRTKCKT